MTDIHNRQYHTFVSVRFFSTALQLVSGRVVAIGRRPRVFVQPSPHCHIWSGRRSSFLPDLCLLVQPRSEGRQSKVGQGQWGHLPGGARHSERRLWERRRDALFQAHCPDSSPGLREELDRVERPHDLSLRYFQAGVSDPLRFQVPKPTCTRRGCGGVRVSTPRKNIWGKFIHPY